MHGTPEARGGEDAEKTWRSRPSARGPPREVRGRGGAAAKPVARRQLMVAAGELLTRFALGERSLGAFSQPNTGSLLDVGNDARGAPYLVMEDGEGRHITAYAHERELDARARIALFLKILDAVQTAHSQLVVHRDIKPGNVLVDNHGEPKLLDFGIAKLLGDSAAAATRTGLGPLTPEYASPEQVRGEPIGTASDGSSLVRAGRGRCSRCRTCCTRGPQGRRTSGHRGWRGWWARTRRRDPRPALRPAH